MVGDVWLFDGQSNMGLPLRFTLNGAEEAKAANCPNIRFFTVAGHPAYGHTDLVRTASGTGPMRGSMATPLSSRLL
jgi:hypothetical protein